MMEYRKAILAIVFFKDKILLVEKEGSGWQFPQGGIEAEEDEKTALLRELYEELGIEQSNIKKIKKSSHSRKYEWPEKIQINTGMKGQMQSAFFVFLNSSDIILKDPQLKKYNWIDSGSAVELFTFDDLKAFAKLVFQEIKELM